AMLIGVPAIGQAQSLFHPQPLPVTTPQQPDDGVLDNVRFVWRDHSSFGAGRNFRVDFQAKFQEDARFPGDDPIAFDTWELHRARVGIDGEIFRRIQFSVERELTENEQVTVLGARKAAWKDYYVDVNIKTALQVR